MRNICNCSLCGNESHVVAFHKGYVCEGCIDYIKSGD